MEESFKSNPFYIEVSGDKALFTSPETKGSGDKVSYQVPTRQALQGIVDACYFKPTIKNVVDEVKVMNKIETQTMGVSTMVRSGQARDLNYYTYLTDVKYLIKCHFEWNLNREDLVKDRNEIKHQEMMVRSIRRGGRFDVFLGTRECVGYIKYLTQNEYYEAESYYDGSVMNFGIQFQEFEYPDAHSEENTLYSYFAPVIMKNGTIQYENPNEEMIKNELSNYNFKTFEIKDIKTVEEELKEFK